MLAKLLCLISLIALTVQATDQYGDGAPCLIDSECDSYCCNNNNNYKVNGTCVAIDEDDRCLQRRNKHRIILHVLLGIFAVTIPLCCYWKHIEDKKDKQRLQQIREQNKPNSAK